MKIRFHKKLGRLIRKKFRERVLSNYGVGILAETKNGRFVVEAGDFAVGRRLLERGEYDYDELQWLRECINKKTNTIVVVGTHIGAFLVPLSQNCNNIYGFEVDKTNYNLLLNNIKLNDINNAHLFNNAIGQFTQTVYIKRNAINTGNTTIDLNDETQGESVSMITLDDALRKEKIDLMIIDIEGHELHALKGGEETIKNTNMIYIEFAPYQLIEHKTNPEELLKKLENNFQYIYLPDRGKIICYPIKEAIDKIISDMNKRGYLVNLLCTKNELPNHDC